MEEQQSRRRLGTGFLLRPTGPAWNEAKKGFAASKRKKAVTGWPPAMARDLAATKMTGTPRDAAVFKRPGVREVATLLDSLPSPALPPVVRAAALSVNTISTLQDYQQSRPRWASAAAAHRAEYEPVQQREAAARESHFVMLDGLPIAVAADTAHGVMCPWNPESSSLSLGKTGDVKEQAALATRQEEGAISEGGTGVASGANKRRRHKGARPNALSSLTPLVDRISSKHKPSGALTDRSAASPFRQSAEVRDPDFGVQSPKAMSKRMFKAPLRSRPTTRSLPSLAVCGAGHQDGSEGKQMESKTERAKDDTNIAVKDMKQSVAWFGSMRDSLWKRPYGKRVISGPPDRSLRSPTRIETDVQVHIAARAPIDWQHPSEWQRRTTKSAHQPPSTAGSRHTWMPLFTLPLSEFVMTNKPSPRKELYQEPFPWRSMPGAETHVRCGPENNGKPDSGIVMHHGISTYEAALQEGGLGSPRRTIAAGSSWKAARPTTIEERDTQRYVKTDVVIVGGGGGGNRGEGGMQGAPGCKSLDTVKRPVDAPGAGFIRVSASSPWKME